MGTAAHCSYGAARQLDAYNRKYKFPDKIDLLFVEYCLRLAPLAGNETTVNNERRKLFFIEKRTKKLLTFKGGVLRVRH